ncbi:type II secretion system GspH family protein [Aerococcaceae bacterium NML191292]|nr:type II secretion system GspH family protein [Aerococcaceae bacterium NML191292]MCW6662500.1 type II secretion system GspH family protein [Aerococcaceae bacterium NML190073]MCW6680121.1 type II secretion system GspH family protein [Aerococcaceae bacterium NML130460]
MKLNKAGFSLVESFVAFVLISLMLMLYLPAFYPELGRLKAEQLYTAQWRLFYELAAIELRSDMPPVQKTQLKEQLQANYAQLHRQRVTFFACDASACHIIFEDGSEWDVSLEKIQE